MTEPTPHDVWRDASIAAYEATQNNDAPAAKPPTDAPAVTPNSSGAVTGSTVTTTPDTK